MNKLLHLCKVLLIPSESLPCCLLDKGSNAKNEGLDYIYTIVLFISSNYYFILICIFCTPFS